MCECLLPWSQWLASHPPSLPFRDEHARFLTAAPASRRQPTVAEHRGEAAAGPAGVAQPVPVVTHHSGARAQWGRGGAPDCASLGGLMLLPGSRILKSFLFFFFFFGFLWSNFQRHGKCRNQVAWSPLGPSRLTDCARVTGHSSVC